MSRINQIRVDRGVPNPPGVVALYESPAPPVDPGAFYGPPRPIFDPKPVRSNVQWPPAEFSHGPAGKTLQSRRLWRTSVVSWPSIPYTASQSKTYLRKPTYSQELGNHRTGKVSVLQSFISPLVFDYRPLILSDTGPAPSCFDTTGQGVVHGDLDLLGQHPEVLHEQFQGFGLVVHLDLP